ncbi:MAG: 30S ribosome-binding factor RbfA [Candidatus Omnitrophica bacterium]|nr:30S ribosome-binding factor RbfA [Candidatus Omnitrophota bacterium]MBU1038587.1 30S ribosome-binding factor RbfA [Candidatus Omnitrophota bacterium]
MSSQRSGRVQEAIRQEVSSIIHSQIRDPRLGFLTITGVELTKDLRYARIYFSVLGGDKEKKLALRGLNSAKGYIKGLLGDRIKLRYMPDIEFKIDETLERTRNIYDLFEKIKKEKKDDTGSDSGDKEA